MKTESKAIPQSYNQVGGFYGAMADYGQDATLAWCAATLRIAAATGGSLGAVRGLLDSGIGSDFGRDVVRQLANDRGLETAIQAAIQVNQARVITTEANRRCNIPVGLPHLTGWVKFHESGHRF
jgi:hypothetical protein